MSHAFTLIELLLVIAIVALLGGATTPFLSQFLLRNSQDTTVDKVLGSLRQAQNYSQNHKFNSVWGLCLSDQNIRLFAGTDCNTYTYHQDFSYSSTVTVSGMSTITFNNRGEPSSPLSVSISSDIDSATISLNAVGGLSVN